MKALQDELKSLRQLLEQQQQQQKPVVFDPSSFQMPFWQPGQFPFSSPMHSGPTHENSFPPAHEGSAPPAHKDAVVPNHTDHVPSTHGGSDGHSERESVTVISDSTNSCSTTSSHGNHHTTSTGTSEPSPAKPHPLTSRVAMDTTAQQQHTQPVEVNGASNKSVNKRHPKRQTSKISSHKNNKQHKEVSSPSPEVQQSDQSDSSISLLSSDTSMLSLLDSARLSPNQVDGFQGDNSVSMETMRVPSSANLTTWVCPLCGGRSVIVDSSGARHRHRQPERAKTRSRSTQCGRTMYQQSGQSPRRHTRPHYEKVLGTENDNFSKPRYTPNVRRGGLHYDSDVSSNGSSGLHHNRGALSNRSDGLHHNNEMLNNKNSDLHHGSVPPVQQSGLHYSSDTPRLRSGSLNYKNRKPGIRSSVLHYNSDTPIVRSTGTQYNSRSRSYRKPRRKFRTFEDDTVTFAHPKATSTPVIIHSTQAHDYSSDSSDVCTSPTIIHQPTDHILVESVPRHRRHYTRPRVPRHRHGDWYLTTSSNEDGPCHHPISR